MGDEALTVFRGDARGVELSTHFCFCLAPHQCFGLCKAIRKEDRVMVAEWVLAHGGREKVRRDQLGPLM